MKHSAAENSAENASGNNKALVKAQSELISFDKLTDKFFLPSGRD